MSRETDLIYRFSGAPTITDDINAGYQINDNWVDEATDISYKCMDNSAGAAVWYDETEIYKNGVSGKISVLAFGNNGFTQINNTTYTSRAGFIFPGSTKLPNFSRIVANAWANNGGATMDVRILDVTNAQVICEVTGIGNTPNALTDMGVLSNIPTNEALWNVQIRRASGAGQARISSIILEY